MRRVVVRADGGSLRLTIKAMQVLLALVEQRGAVVSRELFERVWPDTMPTDDVLTQAVAQLRKAFADDRDAPRYIETISKGGYRLLADVEWLDAGNAAVAPDETGEGVEAAPGADANLAATSDEWEGTRNSRHRRAPGRRCAHGRGCSPASPRYCSGCSC